MKALARKQVLLARIEILDGLTIENISTNVYVSYRSGNTEKFWANLAIATTGVILSTQLNNTNTGEGQNFSNISPIIPLGVSVATIPNIWKNRPRGLPSASLLIQHRDAQKNLIDSWEQPISKEAKNGVELLSIAVNKKLSAGALEIYLQNENKNEIFYWAYETTFKTEKSDLPLQNELVSLLSAEGCPKGLLSNGKGRCYNPINKEIVAERTKLEPLILTREIQSVNSKMNVGFNQFSSTATPPTPLNTSALVDCLDWYLCYGNVCNYTHTTCSGGAQTIDGGGGGGNPTPDPAGPANDAERERRRRCSSVGNAWSGGVEVLKTQHKNNSLNCMPGIGFLETMGAYDTYNSGGMSTLGQFLYALGLFDRLDEMYNCLRAADSANGVALDRLWGDYQQAKTDNNCN